MGADVDEGVGVASPTVYSMHVGLSALRYCAKSSKLTWIFFRIGTRKKEDAGCSMRDKLSIDNLKPRTIALGT